MLKAIRAENEGARIMISDGPYLKQFNLMVDRLGYRKIARGFNAEIVHSDSKPYVKVWVPKPAMMRWYMVSRSIAEADAVVSVAKLKVHKSCGVSLSIKNLFGLLPLTLYGAPRFYIHYPVRLPRCMVDLALLFSPSLCVVEGLIGEGESEWAGRWLQLRNRGHRSCEKLPHSFKFL